MKRNNQCSSVEYFRVICAFLGIGRLLNKLIKQKGLFLLIVIKIQSHKWGMRYLCGLGNLRCSCMRPPPKNSGL